MYFARTLYPMLLQPSLHTKVWGGRKLAERMNKALPTDDPYGESWELHDSATIANGDLAGQSLGDLLRAHGKSVLGPYFDPAAGFPLLAKFLDASDWLSVQVHPNDAQALELEGQPRGKTEAWIVLHAEPGAQLVIGVEPGTTRDSMAAAIRAGTLEEHIVYAQVKTGDVLLLNANTVHALGPGLLIYEIQQSSNTTYRLYDWNRMGLDGSPRELHIEKGVQVANVDYLPEITQPIGDAEMAAYKLVESAYFTTLLYRMKDNKGIFRRLGEYFEALTTIKGTMHIKAGSEEITMGVGDTVLVPASVPEYVFFGEGEVLISHPMV